MAPYTVLNPDQFIALEELKEAAREEARLQIQAWKDYQKFKLEKETRPDKEKPPTKP